MEPVLPAPKPEVPAAPQQEIASAPVYTETGLDVGRERAPQAPLASQPVSTTPTQPQVAAVQPTPAVGPVANDNDTAAPQIADDVDVIEKEWVDKAKRIVSSTKHDPHEQEKQVSRLQADYLMKRYNKQIKVSE